MDTVASASAVAVLSAHNRQAIAEASLAESSCVTARRRQPCSTCRRATGDNFGGVCFATASIAPGEASANTAGRAGPGMPRSSSTAKQG